MSKSTFLFTLFAVAQFSLAVSPMAFAQVVSTEPAVLESNSESNQDLKPVEKSTTPTLPVFVDGEAQIVDGFNHRRQWIWHDLFVETEFDSDGDGKQDRMHVSVCRPEQTKTEGLKVPVIYGTSPYYCGTSDGGPEFFWDPKHEIGATPPERPNPPPIPLQSRRPIISRALTETWVPRGFAVVHSCSPGTGLSQGCPTVGGKNESLAPQAVIDWLCGRAKGFKELDSDEEVTCDWCTGKIGMTGTSYNGTLPIAAATTGVEGLAAIIPVSPNTSYYHYYRSNGLVRHPGGYMGEDVDVLFNFIHSGNPDRREYCDCEVRDKDMADHQDRLTGDLNDWWAARDYVNQLDKVTAATLIAHGFNDWNVMPSHSTRVYEALKKRGVPCQAYFHQDGHGGDPPFKMMNRWFTRYLYGVENEVEKDARAWIVREDAKRSEPSAYADYPHPDAVPVELFTAGDGLKIGELDTSPVGKQIPATLVDDVAFKGRDLAAAETSPQRLLFATQVLQEPVHISGTVSITLKLAANKPAANLTVWLVSLPITENAPINSNLITRGWADPQNSKSLSTSEPLVPGEFYELTFQLEPDDQVIPVGQQIGLMIFSSDRDFTLWPEPGTELTIDPNSTVLQLPVVGGLAAFTKATPAK